MNKKVSYAHQYLSRTETYEKQNKRPDSPVFETKEAHKRSAQKGKYGQYGGYKKNARYKYYNFIFFSLSICRTCGLPIFSVIFINLSNNLLLSYNTA